MSSAFTKITSWLRARALPLSVCVAVAGIGSSCNLDPVHRAGVNGLGPENADLYPPNSEFHRPGEPCGLCHSDKGPADTVFAIGGTVFWTPDDYNLRTDNAYVRILDANKRHTCVVTNCNGNFFIKKEDYANITFPLLMSVERVVDPGGKDESTLVIRRMSSHIGRDSSCATCHIQGLRDFGSPGQVRMYNSNAEFKAVNVKTFPNCPDDFTQVPLCPEDREQ